MSFESNLDPDLVAYLAEIEAQGLDPHTLADLIAGWAPSGVLSRGSLADQPPYEDIASDDVLIPGAPGSPDVRLRIYRPVGVTTALPGLYSIHGGGMVVGSIDADDRICERYAHKVQCVVASVEYRLAPTHVYPAATDDCYAGLQWFAGNATNLGVDPARIAVAGASAGGGLAAATVLQARDRRGPTIAYQLLIRPMLDDRNITGSSREFTGIPGWSREMNMAGWSAYLGGLSNSEVPPYAAPARATDLSALPPTMIQAGELEVLRDEAIDYGTRLLQAGVSTELHVYPGVYHGWDGMVPDAGVSLRSVRDRLEALRRALHPSADPTAGVRL
jgi:acetyl esterase/lipase